MAKMLMSGMNNNTQGQLPGRQRQASQQPHSAAQKVGDPTPPNCEQEGAKTKWFSPMRVLKNEQKCCVEQAT